MAQAVTYVDRAGTPMQLADWKTRSQDASYTTVVEYDNGVVRVTLKWIGKVANPGNLFRDSWPVFMLLVKNYTADGRLVVDPVDSDKTYPDEAKGREAYEAFLARWTESSTNENGEFEEVNNTLTPPKPPDPNLPESGSVDLPEGAW